MSAIPKLKSTTKKASDLPTAGSKSSATANPATKIDDFKVGDRVYVTGTKPGKIAFLGETKFAPNEWAGIILDEPQGKNDGTVGGVQYFECQPMYGIFSRTSRLTRKPVTNTITETPKPPPLQTPLKSRVNRTPSPTGSTISVSSTRSEIGPPTIGDRVIVASATSGTKTGTLRFIGPTEFAQGEWAGVELDGPIGKNDGSVGEKRYFECPPKHGLFAPLHKVSKSPRNKMLRQPSNLTSPSNRHMCRQKSDLSDISVASSTTPSKRRSISSITAPERLRTSLKEKEQKIEQLMKERELERAEIAKAANQTDVAENNLKELKDEFDSYKSTSEEQLISLREEISKLVEYNKELSINIEEEKQKYEDYQFQMEEEMMTRAENDTKKIAELEKSLCDNRDDALSTKNDELKSIQEKLANSNLQIESFKKEIESFQNDLTSERKQNTILKESSKNQVDSLVEKISGLETNLSEKDNIILELEHKESVTSKKFKDLQDTMENSNSEIKNTLLAECQELQVTLKNKDKELTDLTEKLNSSSIKVSSLESSLKEKEQSEIKSLANWEKKLEAKCDEIQELKEKIDKIGNENIKEQSIKDSEFSTLKQSIVELEKVNDFNKSTIQGLNDKIADLEKEKSNGLQNLKDLQILKEDLDKEVNVLKENSKTSSTEIKRLSGTISSKDLEVDNLRQDLSNLSAQLVQLKDVIDQSEKDNKEREDNLVNKHNKETKDYQDKIQKLTTENEKSQHSRDESITILKEQHVKEVEENSKMIDNLKDDLLQKEKECSVLKTQLDKMEASSSNTNELTASLEAKLNKLTDELHESNAQIKNLEQSLESQKNKSTKLNETLLALKNEHQEEMDDMVDLVNDLKLKEDELIETNKEVDKLKTNLESLEKKNIADIETIKDRHKSEVSNIQKSKDELIKQLDFTKDALGSLQVEYDLTKEKYIKEREMEKNKWENEIDTGKQSLKKIQDELANKWDEIEFLKEELKVKTDELEEATMDLEVKEASFSNDSMAKDETHKEEIEILVTKIEDAKSEISDLHEALSRTKAENVAQIDELMKNHKSEVSTLQDTLSNKDRNILDLKANMAEISEKNKESITAMTNESTMKDAKIEKMNNELTELRDIKRNYASSIKSLETDMDQVTTINTELKIQIVEKEEKYQEMSTQIQSMQVSYEKSQQELTERIERSANDGERIEEFNRAIEIERSRVDELQVALGDVESERDDLKNKLSDHEILKEKCSKLEERESELEKYLEDLNDKHKFMEREFEQERNELNDVVHKSKVLLQEKIEEFRIQKDKYETLLDENNQLNGYKRNVLILEQEKRELENKIASLTLEIRNAGKSGINNTIKEEEDENVSNQVDFLNSVIVDMQKKNDELKAKLELFESAGIIDDDEATSSFLFNGISSKQVPPRLFCDICDQFDIHDTEDCPTQAMEIVQEEEQSHSKHSAQRGIQRSYCDHCEIFGHDTENCVESTTY